MKNNYTSVPENILTGKDLNYLCDMFEWNYAALKLSVELMNTTTDKELVNMISKTRDAFDKNLNNLFDILGGTYE